ncbi:MAG: hypothetical protein AAGA11_22800 [Pseudomonadota bacterium]
MGVETVLCMQPADMDGALLQPVLELAWQTGARLDVLVTGVTLPTVAHEGIPRR